MSLGRGGVKLNLRRPTPKEKVPMTLRFNPTSATLFKLKCFLKAMGIVYLKIVVIAQAIVKTPTTIITWFIIIESLVNLSTTTPVVYLLIPFLS